MMKRRSRLICPIFVALLAPAIAYGGIFPEYFSGPEIQGTVTDVETGQPVAGAVVIWRWDGRKNLGWVDSQSVCYRIDLATTDANGRYVFPAWEFYSRDIPSIHGKGDGSEAIYKFGYTQFLYNGIGEKNSKKELNVISIKKDEDYLRSLRAVARALVCTYTDYFLTIEQLDGLIKLCSQLLNDVMKTNDSSEKRFYIKNILEQMNAYQSLLNKKKESEK